MKERKTLYRLLFTVMLLYTSMICWCQAHHCGSVSPDLFSPIGHIQSHSRSSLTIPIVFHIVWHHPEENLSDDLLQSQIQVINDDFNALNVDIIKVPEVFQKNVGNANINFCLADRDPDGMMTSGINRVYTSIENIGGRVGSENGANLLKSSDLGGSTAWDPERYLNVWISARNDGIIGKAIFPNDPDINPMEDGIELDYSVVGLRPDNPSPFNLGRTLTHEIGHYLNLEHLWGKTISCFNEGDMVDDTPTQGEAYFGCPTEDMRSCNSRDMIHNFMNFLDDECLWYFTEGQAQRMIDALYRYRYGLISSGICSEETPLPDDPLRVSTIRQTPFGVQINLRFMPQVNYSLQLYDIAGRKIWSERQNNLSIHLIENNNFPSGIYVLSMSYEDNHFARKVYIH